MISAIPSGDTHDLVLRLRVAVVTPIGIKARAFEMGKAERMVKALDKCVVFQMSTERRVGDSRSVQRA
jgi:hypothetical protein